MEENFNNENETKKPELNNKQEPSVKKKRKKAKIAVITLSTVVVLFLGLQVYASVNGYGNVFFMIKNIFTTGNPAGDQEIFSDKDITLSYKSIELTDSLNIQVNRLEIKDGKTKIYIAVKPTTNEKIPLKYVVSVKDQKDTEITGTVPKDNPVQDYQDVLELDYEVNENDVITIVIKNNNNEELRKLEINLQTREILVTGDIQLEKISQIELTKYLSVFSQLNNGATKQDSLLYIAKEMEKNHDNYMSEENYNNAKKSLTDREFKNAIIRDFYGDKAEFEFVKHNNKDVAVLKGLIGWKYTNDRDLYEEETVGEDFLYGKCLKIEDVNYKDGVYTIKYAYLFATLNEMDGDNLEDLPQYETTIKLKRNNSQLYSKYQIVDIEEGKEIDNKVEVIIEDNNIKDILDTGIYTIKLYNNNELEISLIKNVNVWGKIDIDENRNIPITGISGKIKKMYQSNNGTSVDPITFFILEDGTVQYLLPLRQTYKGIPNSFEINGTVDKVNNVVDLKTNENDVVIAILKNGEEVKIWNEFMEHWNENENANVDTNIGTNNTYNPAIATTFEISQKVDDTNWKQLWPDRIGMKFKVPNSFVQGEVYDRFGKANVVGIRGGIKGIKNENVAVNIEFLNVFKEKLDLENNLDKTFKSTDNRQWTDWKPLKDNTELIHPTTAILSNGWIRRTYGRTRGNQTQVVMFDMQTSATDVEHYIFIKNILESISSTSV